MALRTNRIVKIKATSLATFEGFLAALIGLGVAILYSLRNSAQLSLSTNSVLKGLAFGLATGIVSIIIVPLIYFGIGWVIGLIHGWIFNAVSSASNGIIVVTDTDKQSRA